MTLDDDAGEIRMEDGDGNKLTLNSDGITLETSGDISLKAGGDVKMEGTNVEATANSEFKAEGSSGAEVTSGGTLTVSGSLVQIN